jgi:hypothetical protein
MTTITVPASAAEKRQPNSSTPNSRIPSAIAHLPSDGWTMNAPPFSGVHEAATDASSGSLSVPCSTPNRSRFCASQT